MNRIALNDYSSNELNTLLGQIPFFHDLSLHDHQQYDLLLRHSSIIELAPNEHLLQKGKMDDVFYFLLKGKLDVFPDQECKVMPISQLSPGQVLGALAIVNHKPRNASLAAAKKPATLIATQFTVFGDLEDFSQVKLETKLNLLRIIVNNTRWKLEVYKMNEPEHVLAEKVAQIAVFDGEKNSLAELHFLAEQSQFLGDVMAQWNDYQLPNQEQIPQAKKNRFLSLFNLG